MIFVLGAALDLQMIFVLDAALGLLYGGEKIVELLDGRPPGLGGRGISPDTPRNPPAHRYPFHFRIPPTTKYHTIFRVAGPKSNFPKSFIPKNKHWKSNGVFVAVADSFLIPSREAAAMRSHRSGWQGQ